MTAMGWRQYLKRAFTSDRKRPLLRRRARPSLEALEDRTLPSTITWTGSAGDNLFQTAGNWDLNRAPGAGDNVVINASGVTITESASNLSVLSIQSQAALDITAGSLQVTSGASSVSAALTLGHGASLTATGSGTTFTASGTTVIDGANLFATAGATLSLPGLTSYAGGANYTTTLEATGSGSTLTLSKLTSLTGDTSQWNSLVQVEALAGGTVNTAQLAKISGGPIYLITDGTSSSLDVSSLTSFSGNGGQRFFSLLQVTNGGTLSDGNLTSLAVLNVTVDGSGTWSAGQITSFTGGTLSETGGTLTLSGLTNANGSSLLVSGGATLSLPVLASYAGGANYTTTLEATGANSTLTFAKLASLTGDTSQWNSLVVVEALAGGTVNTAQLGKVSGGPVYLISDGTNSSLDVSSLTSFSGNGGQRYFSLLQVTNQATVRTTASTLSLAKVAVTLGGTSIGVGQLTLGTGASLAGTGTVAGSLTNAGTVTLGPTDRLTIGGNYTQYPAGAFNDTLNKTSSGLQSGELIVGGSVSLGGALNVALASKSQTPGIGDSFTVMSFGSAGGYFSSISGVRVSSGVELAPAVNATTLTLTGVAVPDVVVTSITVPTSGFTGETVTVTWTEQNQGSATATGPWIDNIYYATGSNGSGQGNAIAGQPVNVSLAPGASVTLSATVALPTQPGTYWFVVSTNATSSAPNSGSSTTVASQSTAVSAVPLPDLVVTSITPPTNGVLSGTSVPITFVVTNAGKAATTAATWQDWVILSQDPNLAQAYAPNAPVGYDQILNNQPVILGFHNPSYLDVNQSYTQTVNVPLPVSAQGTWYVYVVPDGTGSHHPFAMAEASRSDKLAQSTGFTVTLAPWPVLTVNPVQAPSQAFSGQPLDVTWTVTNTGQGPTATGSWVDAVYESTKSTFDSTATLLAQYPHQGVLAPGASYTNTQPVPLPVGVSGSFYFFVKTDLNNQVFQDGDTSSNVQVTPSAVTVNLTPPPDLTPTITALPATALASHSLTFTYQVTNNGAGGTPNDTWTDAYYLSPTPTYQAGTAIALGTQTHTGSLDAGASYTNTATVTIPNGISGSYYLIVDTDSAGAVWELPSDVGHKFGSSTGTTQVSSQPADLVVSSANAPGSGLAGSAVLLNWTVLNQGTGDTAIATWQDSVYVSSSSTLPAGTAPIATFTHTGLLGVNGSYTQTQFVTLPIGLSSGTYYLFVQTNTPNPPVASVYESNTANDLSAAMPITVTQQLADLQVTSVTGTATALTGGSVTVSWTVKNAGAGATNSNYWNDDVWLSTNPTLQSGGTDLYLGSVQASNPLAAGASYNASLAVTVPQNLPAGKYYFIVATDRPVMPPILPPAGGNLVFESNEGNNELAESTATTVNLGPAADLLVSNITAPTSAVGGNLLPVSWTVTNKGNANVTVPIQDAVYLSYYPGLDPSARYLGTVTQTGGLAAGAGYTQNASLQLPAGLAGTFYVFVVSDSDGSIYERTPSDSTQYDSTTVKITLPPPADLVAGTVTLPANPVPNQPITITYQVTNNGTVAANGSWYDALYLSPTPTWNVNDPLLGQVHQVQNLAPGASYTGTLTAPLPAVTPGSYYVIVRSNILDTLPETTLTNNLSASVTQASIDAQALTLGQETTATLSKGQSAFYKVAVAADETLRISLQGAAGFSNQLYVSFGTMPTPGQYDYRYQTPGPNQQITVPTTQAGFYYILVTGTSASSSGESYTITPSLVPFSVGAVQPGSVGAGPVTIEIDGAQFGPGTTFQLLGPNHTVVPDQQVTLQDGSTAFVKFDLTKAAQGTYTVQATQAGGATAQLSQALAVVAALPANLHVYLSTPSGVLPGSQGEVTVNFVNLGNTDLLAPLLQLSASNALIKLADQASFGSSPVWFLGTSDSGPAGVLRPGESGSIDLPFQTTGPVGQSVHFSVQIADDSQAMDWAGQMSALRLPTISVAAWNGVFANFVAQVGGTVASYHAALAADATYLGQLGQPTADVLQLLSFEIEKANASYTAQTLATVTDDSLPAPGIPLTFQRSFQQAISGRYTQGLLGYGWATNWDIHAHTDSIGNAAIYLSGINFYYVKQADGSYQSEPGDRSVLTFANGAYRLAQVDGTVYQFNPDGTLNYVQDSNGNRITAAYNAAGQLVSLTAADGESLTLTYNAQGRLATLTDSNGLTETYGYDATGNYLTTYTDRFGTTTYSYVTGQSAAQNNALAQIAFADNTHVYFGYDSQGRLIDQHRDGGAEDVTFSYLTPGGYVRTDGVGDRTTVLFDRFGATAETIDALGNVTHYQYDTNLNLTEVDGPLGTKYTYQYDASGNLLQETDALGNIKTFTFDASNNLTAYTDGNGNTTSYTYNGANDLLSITYANGAQQQYTYNPLGEATQYLDARGQAIGYTYNAQGLVATESFANNTYSFTYDNRGNLLTATDASGRVTTFTYGDPRNPDFLTQVAYPDGTSLRFSYDVVGQRTQSVDQTGFTVNYTYDNLGRLSKLTDGSGKLIVGYTYDKAGRLTQKDLGNGTRTTYGYDADGNVVKITNLAPDHVTVNSFDSYTYDALGHVVTDASQDGTWSYAYDADGQLTSAVFASKNPNTLPNQSLQYAYDGAGNRISATVNGVTTKYIVNNLNEYTSVGSTSYQYDADGNRIVATDASGNTTSYTFDALNELTAVTGPGLSSSYGYDALGNRIAQTVNGVTTNFQIDPTGIDTIVAAFSGSGALVDHYVYGLGLASQVDAAGHAGYYDFGLTGNTIGITNALGHYVNRYAYQPFGQTTTLVAGLPNSFTYGGAAGVQSEADGTVSMRARNYDPSTGQFLSNDPLGLLGGQTNVRVYVGNDPVQWGDPTGLCKGNLGDDWHKLQNDVQYDANKGKWDQAAKDFAKDWGPVSKDLTPDIPDYGKQFQDWADQQGKDFHNWADQQWQNAEKAFQVWVARNHGDPGNASSGGGGGGSCPCECEPDQPPDTPSTSGPSGGPDIDIPKDPNYIFGPAGFGSQNYVAVNQVLAYTILFENQPSAGFPARQVVVTQQLDPGLNWAAFRLGSFGFGGKVYSVPANRSFYQTRINLLKQQGFYVDVTATIDVSTGIATWTFTTIDPTTGQMPSDPTVGFLPPDNGKGIGAGFVSYSLLPVKTDTTGTVINAQATVTFDNQPPLSTPQIFNTIDTTLGLTSAVAALPAFQASPTFPVSWSGTDVGSAVSGYTIDVSDNGGPYVAWLANTPNTQGVFTGLPGHTYRFYSLATDNSGNLQSVPGAAASTAVVADHLVMQTPAQAIPGGQFTVTVDAISPDGVLDTHYNGSVALSLGSGSNGSLTGTTIVSVQNGVATFGSLALGAPGTYTLVAASSTDLLGTTGSVTVAPTTHFLVTAVGSATAGNGFSVTVTALDSGNNTDKSYLGTVHFSSSDPHAGLPLDYTFTAGDNGTKTFTVTLTTAGNQTITATDTTLSKASGVSGRIAVSPAAAASFTVAGFPTSDVSGVAHGFVVTALDAYGNVATGYTGTVHFTSSDPKAVLPADYIFKAADRGVHTFSSTLVGTGPQSLTATDKAKASITGSETGIQVLSAASQLGISPAPASGVMAGQSFTLTVTALTAQNLPDASFVDTIHFTSSDSHAVLPADYTFLPGDQGTKSFSFTLETAGSATITVTNVTRPTIKSATGKATVHAASAASFKVTGFPAADISGVAHGFVVTAYDAYGNVALGYLGTVHFVSLDLQAKLPANYTFTPADKGVHSFQATLGMPGVQWLAAADMAGNGKVIGIETGITVFSPATKLLLAGVPTGGTTAGQPFTLTVTAQKAGGKTDTQFVDTIHFTSSDPQAILPADYTFVPADQGTQSFTFTLQTAGAQSITVTDISRPASVAIPAGRATVAVAPASAALFSLASYPTSTLSGSAHSFTLTVLDAHGNRATGYRGTVHFTSTDSSAMLPGDYTFTAADKGMHTFTATLVSPGSQALVATDTVQGTITGQASGINVASAANRLALSGWPTSTTAGQACTVTVTALNTANGTDTLFPDTIHFTSSDPHAVLPADYTFTLADRGTHTFTFWLPSAGNETVTVTDLTRPAIQGAAASMSVKPGSAVALQVSGFQSLTLVGAVHSFTVTALDAYGNVATGYTGTVHFTSSDPGQPTLPADYTFTPADKGVHTFQAALNTTQGTQTLTATDKATASISGTEASIAVTTLSANVTGLGSSSAVVGVPGQPLSFTVTAGGANEPAGAVYTYHIDWIGNGKTVQTVTGGSSLTVTNIYPATGSFLVKVTVTDAAGNVSPQAATLPVSIVSATIEADPTNSAQSDLFVGGTTGNDTITLTPAASDTTGTQITVTVNGHSAGTFPPTGQTVGLIVVCGQAGNDTIQEVANAAGVKVAVPAILLAGPGNSTLSAAGSSATNVLVGGSGNDSLIGGAGRDILIGGGGAATLQAGTGDDILIGGSTSYDANVVALEAIAQEWARTDRTYHQRVQDLFGNGAGGQNLPYLLDAQTVARHTAVSQLFGSTTGQDWFWLSDPRDQVAGYVSGEVETFE